ncbi:hypothetical protein B0H14DRAFT_3482894 [Mycena olivaceomarginata]|nr:hypothetical protein B0H14DRAFT_3482894 [Mycena olivaceomarginata]
MEGQDRVHLAIDAEGGATGVELASSHEMKPVSPSLGDGLEAATEPLVDEDVSSTATDAEQVATPSEESEVNHGQESTEDPAVIPSLEDGEQTPTEPLVDEDVSSTDVEQFATPSESSEVNHGQDSSTEDPAATPPLEDELEAATEPLVDADVSLSGSPEGNNHEQEPEPNVDADGSLSATDIGLAGSPEAEGNREQELKPKLSVEIPSFADGAQTSAEPLIDAEVSLTETDVEPTAVEGESPEVHQEPTSTAEVSAGISSLGDEAQTADGPPVHFAFAATGGESAVDAPVPLFSSGVSVDDEGDEFYDSPEGPGGF